MNQSLIQCSRLIEVFIPLEMVCPSGILCVPIVDHNLSSDAKRPACSTCLRSHAYAISNANAAPVLPLEPECTYDKSMHCIYSKHEPDSPVAEVNPSVSSTASNSICGPEPQSETSGCSKNSGDDECGTFIDQERRSAVSCPTSSFHTDQTML